MKCKTENEKPIPYLKKEDNKVILDFSIDQHSCSYYIDIWDALCGVIQAANNMEDFPYGDTLFAIGVKLEEGKSYSVILTKYNLYVLGFADFNEGFDAIPSGSKVIIFNIKAVAYPKTRNPRINIREADLLINQFQNMYSFWEQIKNNQINNAIYALRPREDNGPSYFIPFLVVVWFISEAAREETGRIAWLMNLNCYGKITGNIVEHFRVLAEDDAVQGIWNKCNGLFMWEANKTYVFTNWNQIAKINPPQNYITVQKIAEYHHITSNNIVETLQSIFRG